MPEQFKYQRSLTEDSAPQTKLPSISDGEINAYLDGELSEERMQEIDALARQDPELEAKLIVIGYLSDAIAGNCADILEPNETTIE